MGALGGCKKGWRSCFSSIADVLFREAGLGASG